MDIVEIREEPIELYKLLKLANITASGGEAKMVVAEGLVRVNGIVETRKRKKLLQVISLKWKMNRYRSCFKAILKNKGFSGMAIVNHDN